MSHLFLVNELSLFHLFVVSRGSSPPHLSLTNVTLSKRFQKEPPFFGGYLPPPALFREQKCTDKLSFFAITARLCSRFPPPDDRRSSDEDFFSVFLFFFYRLSIVNRCPLSLIPLPLLRSPPYAKATHILAHSENFPTPPTFPLLLFSPVSFPFPCPQFSRWLRPPLLLLQFRRRVKMSPLFEQSLL